MPLSEWRSVRVFSLFFSPLGLQMVNTLRLVLHVRRVKERCHRFRVVVGLKVSWSPSASSRAAVKMAKQEEESFTAIVAQGLSKIQFSINCTTVRRVLKPAGRAPHCCGRWGFCRLATIAEKLLRFHTCP